MMWVLAVLSFVTAFVVEGTSSKHNAINTTSVIQSQAKLSFRPACRSHCKYVKSHKGKNNVSHIYKVIDQEIVISYEKFNLSRVHINCKGSNISFVRYLNFYEPLSLRSLTLQDCVLAAESIAVFPSRHVNSLSLLNISTPLIAAHLKGFENVTDLHIDMKRETKMSLSFLKQLKNLKSLSMWNVTISSNELNLMFVQSLELHNTGIETFSTILSGCVKLRRLYIVASSTKYLPERWLVNCTNITELIIQNTYNLKSMPPGLLSSLKSLEIVAFKSGGLTLIPSNLLNSAQKLKILDLSSNTLENLPLSFNDTRNLLSLNLSHNTLRTLSQRLLSNVNKLQRLDLSSNMLKKIPTGFLISASNLLTLNLTRNSLMELSNNFLRNNKKLLHLDVSKNDLVSLPLGMLNSTSNLQELYLNLNKLNLLPTGFMNNATHIQILNLEWNNLKTLPTGFLNSANNLKELNLGNNKLKTLPIGFLCDVKNLIKIDMSSNELESLPQCFLQKSNKLQKVDLSINKIKNLPIGFLNSAIKVQEINLLFNLIETMPRSLPNNATIKINLVTSSRNPTKYFHNKSKVQADLPLQKNQTKSAAAPFCSSLQVSLLTSFFVIHFIDLNIL